MISALLVLACCISAPPEVTVSADSITMGSLIPFGSSDARSNIALGYSPAPGLARRFLRDEILAKILSAGFSTDDLRLPEAILVRRASQKLDRRQVERAVTDAFARQYPSARIEISYVDIPDIQVGTGNLDFLATISPHS